MVEKLQHKTRTYKKQIEDAEEIAALNLAKFRKAQQQLEEVDKSLIILPVFFIHMILSRRRTEAILLRLILDVSELDLRFYHDIINSSFISP